MFLFGLKMSVLGVLWLPSTPAPTFKKKRQRKECRTKPATENPERCARLEDGARKKSRNVWNV